MTVKWKYLTLSEGDTVYGTNDEAKARAAAEYDLVIDVERGVTLNPLDPNEPESEIPELPNWGEAAEHEDVSR